ncbi:sugar kinase [Termitidicoccus mucosus]|uniref:Carbohydrate kinase n=1 Tax=Termitidicoccus mucosus TaxID=1184151 RepID=A0A178INW1_9BACT|nr:carbohydrate kinase [Opitutaceae bacterium TSB47]
MKPIVTFGEIMGRLCPPGYKRFIQSMPGTLELTFAGAEANVAASLAIFGSPARFVTALPDNVVGDACVQNLRGLGVDISRILRVKNGRLGLYFVEKGANQRPSNVVYDRSHSAIAETPAGKFDWPAIFDGAGWLHISGITPALSRIAFESSLAAARHAKAAGLTVSCDLNFRKKLWQWEPGTPAAALARRCMGEMLPYVDVAIANEEDASDVLGIRAEGSDIEGGHLAINRYPQVAREITRQFPNIKKVAITLRESISATHNNWGAMLYDAVSEAAVFAPTAGGAYRPYEIRAIVDRVGGGDSFAAGLVFALNTPELAAPETAVAFAAAASCLAHSIEGDYNFSTRAEVESLMHGSASGRVVR